MSFKTKTLIGSAAGMLLALLFQSEGAAELVSFTVHASSATGNVDLYTTSAQVMGMGITFMQFLMHIIIKLLEALLDPEFILSFESDSNPLLSLWQFSRDIMNVLFALMLVGSAIYWVVTANGEKIKPNIGRFVIGIILVNFSWFFPRVIMDIANVTTATVYQLPALYYGDNFQCSVKEEVCSAAGADPTPGANQQCQYLKNVWVFNMASSILNNESGSNQDVPQFNEATMDALFFDQMVVEYAPLAGNSVGNGGKIFYGLVYNLGRVGSLDRIVPSPSNPSAPNDFSDVMKDLMFFIISTMFVFAIHTMLFFPLLAMVSAFVMRIIVLWLTVAFMPFMFLSFVTGGNLPGIPVNTMEIFNHYVKAAFLPAVTGLALSVGFIMIESIMSIQPPANFDYLTKCSGTVVSGVGTWWTLLFLIVTYFVIWKGFFMTLEKYDSLYAGAAGWAKSLGGSIGGGILKAPAAIPFIPTTSGGTQSPKQLGGKVGAALGLGKGAGGGSTSPGKDQVRAGDLAGQTALHRDLTDILKELRKPGKTAAEKNTLKQDFIVKMNGGLKPSNQVSTTGDLNSNFKEAIDAAMKLHPSTDLQQEASKPIP